jgi:hypothetical protein
MKLILGLAVGIMVYAAWKLSEPAPGERGELSARLERLKREWEAALAQGKAAGIQTRQRMEEEFSAIFTQPIQP